MVIFPKITSVDGYIEPRIMRLNTDARKAFTTTYGAVTLNPYLWNTLFPEDSITLDSLNNSDIIFLGDDQNVLPIDYSTKDSNAAIIRSANLQIVFNDKNGFSGKDGNDVVIDYQNLFSEGKTYAQHLFKDKSDACNYIYWETLYDANANFLKVLFVGDISKDTMPDQTLLLRNATENPPEQLRTATIQLHIAPLYDRVAKYKMRDLIYNHFQDGNIPIAETDMDAFGISPSHPHNKAFLAGFKAKIYNGSPGDIATISGFDASGSNTNIPDNFNLINALLFTGGNGAQAYLTTEQLTSWRQYAACNQIGNINRANTLTGCDPNSFRNGYFGIKLSTIARKIAEWVGCDPSILATFDTGIVGGTAEFNNGTNAGFDCNVRTKGVDGVGVWNDLFGLDPQGCGIRGAGIGGDHSVFGTKQSTTIANAITVYATFLSDTVYGHQSDKYFTDGMEVLIEGADDPNANGIWTIANVSYSTAWDTFRQVNFDLVNSDYSKPVGAIGGTITQFFSTPITFTADDGFDVFIKNILWQFHYKLKFSITQSGSYIGMPVMEFVNRFKAGNAIPDTWRDGEKFNKQPRKVGSDCIRVSQMGDTGYCKCPANGKLAPIDIPALRWRTHQVGTSTGIFSPNMIYDASPGKNLYNQSDVAYGYSTFGDILNIGAGISIYNQDLSGNGWIPGSYLYESYIDAPNFNPRYPSLWNNWSDVNAQFASPDWSGFYALQSLFWKPDATILPPLAGFDPVSLAPNQFNALFDIARLVEMELVGNKEMYLRDFINVSYLDDPDGEYEIKWQEGGVLVSYKANNRQYDRLNGRILNSEWEASPVDANGNVSYTDLSGAPNVKFFGGVSSSTTSSSSAGSTSGGTVNNTNTYITKFNDTYTPKTRTVKLYSGGVVVKTFNSVMTFEYYDSVNSRTVVQYGFVPEYEPQTYDNYGFNSLVLFHYKGKPSSGTEHGNVEIVGVSSAGVPDYWWTDISQVKQGKNNTDMDYRLQAKTWSEDKSDWLMQRFLEAANPNRRIFVQGRIQFDRDFIGGTFTNLTFKTLTSPEYNFSDDECKKDSDLGITGATRAAPTLTGLTNTIQINWGTRLKPVSIQSQAWLYYENAADHTIANAMDIQMGANPCINQLPTVNDVTIHFWANDFAGAVGARHISITPGLTIDGYGARYPNMLWVVDFWGDLEIIGENATIT